MDIFIYAICDPDTSEIRYIGKTNNLKRRINEYKRNRTSTLKEKFIDDLKLNGKEPLFKVLEICNENNWGERERYYIRKYKLKNSLLNNYKGIFKSEISIENKKDKQALNELLINSVFYRFEKPITIQKYYEFDLVLQLENGKWFLVYDNRRNSNNNEGYYHIYMRREKNMPVPSNYTGYSYEYAINKNLIMRYPIPKKHTIYRMNLLELPIIKGPIFCYWQKGIIDIQPC